MSYLLKDIYSPSFYDKFSDTLEEVVPRFDRKQFIQAIFDTNWKAQELKERMKPTSLVLPQFLTGDFGKGTWLFVAILN